MTERAQINTVSELVDAFGGNKPMADWADAGETAVCNWKAANEIPRGYHLRMWLEADRRGLSINPKLFGVSEYVHGRVKRSRPSNHV